jgi:acyl-CoA thioester hydrolase
MDHTLTFYVRHYECDPNGHLGHANYLRYIHETYISALAASGHSLERPSSPKLTWHPVEMYIDYLRPLFFKDQVLVRAGLKQVIDDRTKWSYEFIHPESNEIHATSQIVYSLRNIADGLQVSIPPEFAAQQPAVTKPLAYTPIEFPPLVPRPPGAFTQPWKVEWRDVDPNQYLNIAAYVDYLLDFVLNAAAACGWTFERSRNQGFAFYIRRQWLRIMDPIRFSDQLLLTTWLSNIKRATLLRHFTIQRLEDGREIGQSHTLWACVDPRSGRPVRIPEIWVGDFAVQISRG